jgi:hypothetical protein
MKRKKLKYVIEARLPLPSHDVILCVRAEGNDRALSNIAFGALEQLFEIKWRQLSDGIHRLTMLNDKTALKKRDANGRYVKSLLLPMNVSGEIKNQRERLRLVNTYNAFFAKAPLKRKLLKM